MVRVVNGLQIAPVTQNMETVTYNGAPVILNGAPVTQNGAPNIFNGTPVTQNQTAKYGRSRRDLERARLKLHRPPGVHLQTYRRAHRNSGVRRRFRSVSASTVGMKKNAVEYRLVSWRARFF